jgi:hypothetical protein
VSKTYQKNRRAGQAATPPAEVAVPEQVVVSMAEIAESAKEGLLALAVSTGLQVMTAMFEEDVTALWGPERKHNGDRAGYRHGSEAGSVTLGGRRIPMTRPRVRAADGSAELHLASYDLFSSTEVLGRLAMERMLAGLSSRRYGRGLEPAGQQVEQAASATSKSAVSRRFVAATETALLELMTRRLDGLDLVAFMVDGVHYGEHTRLIDSRVRVALSANELHIFDGTRLVAVHPRLTAAGAKHLELDHYLEILVRKPGALPGSAALAQARATGVFTSSHEAFWAAARARHGDAAGTRALIEVLLLHRRMPPAQVIAGIQAALTAGACSADVVAVEARKHAAAVPGGTGDDAWPALPRPARSRAAVVTLPRRGAELPADARPAPSVAAYDQLLAPPGREGGA